MEKLVEDIIIGDVFFVNDVVKVRLKKNQQSVSTKVKNLTLVDFYSVNGEGRGFVTKDENENEFRFSKACGTYLTVL